MMAAEEKPRRRSGHQTMPKLQRDSDAGGLPTLRLPCIQAWSCQYKPISVGQAALPWSSSGLWSYSNRALIARLPGVIAGLSQNSRHGCLAIAVMQYCDHPLAQAGDGC